MNKLFLIIGMSFIVLFIGFSAVDIGEANDVIYACKHKDEGMLRMVEDHSYCRPSEEPVSWSATGGLDVSKLYLKLCETSGFCPCDDENDLAITGGVQCKVEGTFVYQSILLFSRNVPPDGYLGDCKGVDGESDDAFVQVLCYAVD